MVGRYRAACAKLITQFKTARKVTQPYVPDVRKFMKEYRLDCEAALDRLESGTSPRVPPVYERMQGASDFLSPLTRAYAGVPDNPDVTIDPKIVAETVQFFITAMDALKLNQTAVDQVCDCTLIGSGRWLGDSSFSCHAGASPPNGPVRVLEPNICPCAQL